MLVLNWQLALQASVAVCLLFMEPALAQDGVVAVATDLDSIYANYMSPPAAVDEAMFSYAKTGLVWKENNTKLLVEVISSDAGAESLLQPALKASGFETTGCSKYGCSGFLPLENYQDLVAYDAVKLARPSFPRASQAGSKISEALQSLRVDDVREDFPNLDGSGLKIGILSDSYDTLRFTDNPPPTTAADDVASGDLPDNVVLVKEISNLDIGSDEARAIAQLIHDLVPGAELFVRTAFDGLDDFAFGIQELASLGCDVIVDDVSKCDVKTLPAHPIILV